MNCLLQMGHEKAIVIKDRNAVHYVAFSVLTEIEKEVPKCEKVLLKPEVECIHEHPTRVTGRMGGPEIRTNGQLLVKDVLEEGTLAVYDAFCFKMLVRSFDCGHDFRMLRQPLGLRKVYL